MSFILLGLLSVKVSKPLRKAGWGSSAAASSSAVPLPVLTGSRTRGCVPGPALLLLPLGTLASLSGAGDSPLREEDRPRLGPGGTNTAARLSPSGTSSVMRPIGDAAREAAAEGARDRPRSAEGAREGAGEVPGAVAELEGRMMPRRRRARARSYSGPPTNITTGEVRRTLTPVELGAMAEASG